MKTLIYRYGSICEPDIIDGFKELEIEVFEIDIEVHDKTVLPRQTVEVVSKYLQDTPVDFVFSVNFFPALSEVCNIFHIRYFSWTVDCPVLEIFANSISNEWNRTFLFDRSQYNELVGYNPDRIFHLPLAANPVKMQERIQNVSNESAVLANQSNSSVNKKPSVCNNELKYSHDIAFVGSLYSEKCPYDEISGISDYAKGFLHGLINAQRNVYGYYFVDEALPDDVIEEIKCHVSDFDKINDYENYITDRIIASQYYIASKITVEERLELFKKLSDNLDMHIYTASNTEMMLKIHNHGTCSTLTEMPVIFNRSKININTTSKAIRSGIPLRVFDILSCKGFLISNYQPELTEFFTPGSDLIMYSSSDECLQLCRYYLEHETERKEIAMAGYETLCKYHTYKIRLAQMITTGFEI